MSATQIDRIVSKWDNTKKIMSECPFNKDDGKDMTCQLLTGNEKILICEYNKTHKVPGVCPLREHVLMQIQ